MVDGCGAHPVTVCIPSQTCNKRPLYFDRDSFFFPDLHQILNGKMAVDLYQVL